MRDVLLMVEHLFLREEMTVKIIIDCLYDIGSVNLINQKVGLRPLNRLMKTIARLSKPAFRCYAWRWFRGNCPELITHWLHTQVSFEPKSPENSAEHASEVIRELPIQATEVVPPALPAASESIQEIQRLRTRVKLLAGLLIGAIILFGSTLILGSPS